MKNFLVTLYVEASAANIESEVNRHFDRRMIYVSNQMSEW